MICETGSQNPNLIRMPTEYGVVLIRFDGLCSGGLTDGEATAGGSSDKTDAWAAGLQRQQEVKIE